MNPFAIFRRRARKLLFEHVPKCGGTATRRYLERHYAPRSTYTVYGWRPDEVAAFKKLPERRRHAFELIIGHGAHELIDWCATDVVAATVLREPIDRVVSHYYYVLERPEHHLHDSVAGRKMSLGEYVASGVSPEVHNNMVCRFLGIGPDEAERDANRSLEAAWETLQSRYQVVGIVERLNAAMEAIRNTVGLAGVWSGEKTNRTHTRKPLEALSAEDRRVIEEHNALDIELYRRVAEAAPG